MAFLTKRGDIFYICREDEAGKRHFLSTKTKMKLSAASSGVSQGITFNSPQAAGYLRELLSIRRKRREIKP